MKWLPLSIFFLISTYGFSQDNISSLTIKYPQYTFDSDTCCWRKFMAEKQYLEAAHLIVAYLKTNNPTRRHSLNWHAGQMFAMANDYSMAKKYFKRTYSIFYAWFGGIEGKTWYYYAKGTVAFLKKDKKTFESIIQRWAQKFPQDNNYKALLKLQKNWEKSYEEALRN